MKMNKWLAVIVSVTMLGVSLVGCQSSKQPEVNGGGADTQAVQEESKQEDVADLPTLKYYFVADKANPEDVELVQDALNEAIASKIGAKVELNPLSFAEVTTKLPLILTTGDDADVISISQLAPYITSYQTGGLLALDDLLQKEAPELYKMYDETIWDSEKIKGNIYMVPCYYPGVSYPGMWTAKERTDKYGFDWENCSKWEDYEPYFDAILENEEGVTPILSSDEYWGRLWFPGYYGYESVGNVQSPKGQGLVCIDAVNGKTDVFAAPFGEEYEESIRLMRKWYEKGYVLKTPPTEEEMGNLRSTGKMAAFLHCMSSTWDTTAMGQAEWGGDTILQCILQGHPSIIGSTGSGNAVTKASQHPEEAIKFIQEMHTNEYVHNLLNWGIEDVHWKWVNEDKKVIDFADGKTIDTVGYYPNTTWQFGNRYLQYFRSEGDIATAEKTDEMLESNAVLSPIMGFIADTEPVKTEMANVANVAAEYGDPLEKGLVDPDDPERGLEMFRQKLKEAGIEKIVGEIQTQLDTWLAENKK